jgi:peptide/nickel transport system permease protein
VTHSAFLLFLQRSRPVLLQRLLQAAIVTLLVCSLCFLIVQQLPGDIAFRLAAGRYGYDYVNGAVADAVRLELGLDLPAWKQFIGWLGQLASGDLGVSQVTGNRISEELRMQFADTLELASVALLLATLIGLPIGVLSGLRPHGWLDRMTLAWTVAARALPAFLFGLILIVVFSVQLGWLPAAGHDEEGHLLLPALTLSMGLAGLTARIVRDNVIQVTQSEYYRFALTKGLTPAYVFLHHGLRNIGVTLITYAGMQLILLLEGVVVVESLFAWPGIGHALVHAVFWRDVPMIQGCALLMAWLFVGLNMLVDFACLAVDPRGRHD